MNIKELKSIINSGLSDDVIKSEIINSLAKDENVIPVVMRILERERQFKKEIHNEMNVLLSKAHIGLDDKKFNEGNFIQKEIIDFYTKYMRFCRLRDEIPNDIKGFTYVNTT